VRRVRRPAGWSAEPAAAPAPSSFAGAPDLNDDRAIETNGVLFMEGEGEPTEITRIKSELETIAASSEQNGSWLASAMEASWAMAEALLSYPGLADLQAERHKIIGNDFAGPGEAGAGTGRRGGGWSRGCARRRRRRRPGGRSRG